MKIRSKPHIIIGIFGTSVNRWDKKLYLKDGGAALLIDGELKIAISEERINRRKHSTGFESSVQYCLDEFDLLESDIDIISLSNCCDYPVQINGSFNNLLLRNSKKLRIVQSHHDSHAILAAFQSGFNECIVMVADNEGNLLDDRYDDRIYCRNSLERVSFYIFRNGRLSLVERNCEEPDNIGLGDTYHYFTHYLGWHSYTQAGRVMGLSAYGNRDKYKGHALFELNSKYRIQSKISNDRARKLESVFDYGKIFSNNFPKYRDGKEPITEEHMDIAAWIQAETEDIITQKINLLVNKTGIRKVCISGGIGYNCLANRAVYKLPNVTDIFIPYAPGDEGQPIGNALIELSKTTNPELIQLNKSPFLGRLYSDKEIINSLHKHNGLKWELVKNIEITISKLLAKQKIIGWFQGKSEMGSRALGNRSIIMDPRFIYMKDKLNFLKGREWYRPVAPSVLEEYQNSFFDINCSVPYMNIAAKVKKDKRDLIPAVTHEDNTARIHSVRKQDNQIFYNLITEFNKLTGIPLIANTSFNFNGDAIVETPEDAIKSFISMNLDYLAIGNYLISK